MECCLILKFDSSFKMNAVKLLTRWIEAVKKKMHNISITN